MIRHFLCDITLCWPISCCKGGEWNSGGSESCASFNHTLQRSRNVSHTPPKIAFFFLLYHHRIQTYSYTYRTRLHFSILNASLLAVYWNSIHWEGRGYKCIVANTLWNKTTNTQFNLIQPFPLEALYIIVVLISLKRLHIYGAQWMWLHNDNLYCKTVSHSELKQKVGSMEMDCRRHNRFWHQALS